MSPAPAASALPLLRCFAGGVPLGFPAEEVSEFHAPDEQAPRLAPLLGLEAAASSEERTLRLRSGGREALLRVEGPVSIRPLGDRLLPVPPFLSRLKLGPVIGFAEEDGRVVVLVDAGRILRLCAEQRAEAKGA